MTQYRSLVILIFFRTQYSLTEIKLQFDTISDFYSKYFYMSKLLRGNSSDSDINHNDSVDDLTKSVWHSTWTYIYNPQKNTCCARTLGQWAIMGFYYIAYTIFIVGLFLGLLYGCRFALKFTSEEFPLVDKASFLDNPFPGLGLFPSIVNSKFPIIWYSADPDEHMTEKVYIEQIDKFFSKYKQADRTKYSDCESERNGSKPCYFDLNSLGECNDKGYYYTNSSLCFFLKMNKLMDWTPVYYQKERELIHELNKKPIQIILNNSKKNVISIECNGKNFWDREYLGDITYYPQQGFKGYYFPYKGESEYLSPVIAIKLNNITTGVVIHIACRIWLKNVDYRLNHVNMKIFVDNTLPY